MQSDPFHTRTWAEILFFFAMSAVFCFMGVSRSLEIGTGPSIVMGAMGAAGMCIMGAVASHKLKRGQSRASRHGKRASN